MTSFKAVVFDWAGTMIDFGSAAPVAAFIETFAQFDVCASPSAAREPMGMAKRDHIAAMLAAPEIAAQWRSAQGAAPDAAAVDALYAVFRAHSDAIAAAHAQLIPGAAEAVAAIRARGLKIGSTTGYTRSTMAEIAPVAAAQGYAPDNLVCSDDLPETRPGPLGMYKCFIDLRVYPPSAVIKVDDTAPGVAEGVAAGCVTVGCALSGNYVGKTPAELSAAPADAVAEWRAAATAQLRDAGADHVIDTVADLPALIAHLDSPG